MEQILRQFGAICAFLLLMGFTFCDGYKLRTIRKLIWFSVFTAIAIRSIKVNGMFVLEEILPIPCLLAFILGWYEMKIKQQRNSTANRKKEAFF